MKSARCTDELSTRFQPAIYVGPVIVVGALFLFSFFGAHTFTHPYLFATLLILSAVDIGLQGQPAPRQERLDDVGVVRSGFHGAHHARPERNDARRRRERVEPVHVPDEDAEPALPDAVQHGVPRDHGAGRGLRLCGAGRVPGPSAHTVADIARPFVGAAIDVFRLQHLPHRGGRSA